MKRIQGLSCEKRATLWLIHIFCNILDNLSNFVYVNEKFCKKKNLFRLVQQCVGKFSHILYCLHKMYRVWINGPYVAIFTRI